jgi:hypothetical protein
MFDKSLIIPQEPLPAHEREGTIAQLKGGGLGVSAGIITSR